MLRRGLICLILATLAGFAAPANAQSPELSADEPIYYDAGRKVLVAAGNARFEHEQAIVEADEIRFDQEAQRITAAGNVRVTQEGLRLVTHQLTYNLETRRFASGPYRAGYPPVFLEGAAFEGTLDEIEMADSTVYFREPEPSAPRLSVGSASLEPNDRLAAREVELNLPLIPAIPLPSIDREFGAAPPVAVEGSVGYRGNLGAYARSRLLLPLSAQAAVGANLDLYSARGVLIGPALRYTVDLPDRFTDIDFTSGWIHDSGERGVDVLGDPIDIDRYFAQLRLRHVADSLEIAAFSQSLSDSEVMRDFRPSLFEQHQQADSYLEVTQLWNEVFFSFFLRDTPNDFYGLTDRLPEVRAEQPATPLAGTGVFYSWSASYVHYRTNYLFDEEFTDFPTAPYDAREPPLLEWLTAQLGSVGDPYHYTGDFGQRGDAQLVLQRPVALNGWTQFVPRAAVRGTTWKLPDGGTASRTAGELGFDLATQAYGEWELKNRTWRIDGLRHLVRPILQYRWQPASFSGDPLGIDAAYDRRLYSPLLPVLDLADRRDADTIADRQIARLGVQNRLITRDVEEGGTRTLLEVDFYQDLIPSMPNGESDWQGTYLMARSSPARWLDLSLAQKFHTEDLNLEETRLGATIRSAELWQLDFSVDFLDEVYDQYRLEGFYQVTPRITLFGGLRFDADLEEFTRQVYGVRHRLGRAWELTYAVSFRQGSEREDDFSLELGLRLLDF